MFHLPWELNCIHAGAEMWLFHAFMKHPGAATLIERSQFYPSCVCTVRRLNLQSKNLSEPSQENLWSRYFYKSDRQQHQR